FQLSRALTENAPVASGILIPNGAWRIREYYWPRPRSVREAKSRKFGIDAASFNDAKGFRIISDDMLEVYRYDRPLRVELNTKAVDSTLRLWGEGGQEILNRIRVGIAGLGGVGSILAEFLARLGVGELVLIDFDIVSEENLNRLVGARRNEINKPKIEYAARIAKEAATAKNFIVRPIRESVAEWDGLRHLLDVDVVMNAADSPFARQVLDHVAYAYGIPVIDGGTILRVESKSGKVIGKSQVGKAGPGDPCLECSGSYTQEDATMAREEPSMQGPDAYVQTDKPLADKSLPRAPSVISFNGLVASLMVQRMLNTFLGFPPQGKHGQQRYYIDEGILNWGPTERCKNDCPKYSWTGLGDSHPVPVGVDPIWKEMRKSFTSKPHKKRWKKWK
ncbi:MAG: ThiF family adenylyltransferase, partial [Patescibacteria group bacterium]|nr:ThiF family adenylyltransferase [Patescibacteria group bacterium]